MKLKAHGQIWDVDYISATNKDGRVWNFFSNYELIPDGPQSSCDPHARIDTLREAIDHNTTSCERITGATNAILKRVESIEEEYAKAKSWINTLISDNQRLKDRLNAIESGYAQGEP